MNIQQYSKLDIATNLIETALTLFFAKGDLFSVITLAGAAEEILGQFLHHHPGAPGRFRSLRQILRPARQEVEQESFWGHESETSLHLDPFQESVFLLNRAIADYLALTGEMSGAMRKFQAETRIK